MKASVLVLFETVLLSFALATDPCREIVCGKNAIKSLSTSDSQCLCSCPSDSQGDPYFECSELRCGTVVGMSRWIMGGRNVEEAEDSQWPWMVSIGFWSKSPDGASIWNHQCGGSLITHFHVITAAHCTLELDIRTWTVQLGAINLKNSEGEDWTEMKIESIEIHPNFKVKSNAAYYDVAVICLISAVEFNDKIRPVCIPETASGNVDSYNGSSVSISGWGRSGDQHGATDVLKTAHLTIYLQSYCKKLYEAPQVGILPGKIRSMLPNWFEKHILCAGLPGEKDSACHGDSGGPMVKFFSSPLPQYIQLGIIQGGAKCGDEYLPGLFISLTDSEILHFVKKASGLLKGNKNEYGPSITSGPPTIASPQPITITTLATATKIVSKEENQINDDESGSFKLFEINRTHSENTEDNREVCENICKAGAGVASSAFLLLIVGLGYFWRRRKLMRTPIQPVY